MAQKVFNLYRGGNALGISNFRCDGLSEYSEAMPREVAAEYAGGHYVFSFPLAPNDMRWQRNAFRSCDAVAAGDFISMLRIPSKHRVNGVTMELKVQDSNFPGWKLALRGYVYTDGEQSKVIDFDTPIALAEKDGEKTFVFTTDFDQVLMENEHLILGLQVVSAKDADEMPLSEFNGQVAVTAIVQRLSAGVLVL